MIIRNQQKSLDCSNAFNSDKISMAFFSNLHLIEENFPESLKVLFIILKSNLADSNIFDSDIP